MRPFAKGLLYDERVSVDPWALLEPHEAQARANHGGQSLKRLAERGGLGVRGGVVRPPR